MKLKNPSSSVFKQSVTLFQISIQKITTKIFLMSISNIQIKSFQHLLMKRQELSSLNTLQVGLPDAACYYYSKEGSFFSKKEEHWQFYFFQGLNTKPQNLSVFMRDESQSHNKKSKEKLNKGIFMVYDIFSKSDFVIQINIPGNLRIFKIENGKKQLVNNDEVEMMYVSSILRSMYEINLPWGRYYSLFNGGVNPLNQYEEFLKIFAKHIVKQDINLGNEYEPQAKVKGSHACSLLLTFIQERRLVHQTTQMLTELFYQRKELKESPKMNILLAQLYQIAQKNSKSLQIVSGMVKKFNKDPFLLYYQAKYMYEMSLYTQSLQILNFIVQYNQFEIWILLANVHLQLKNHNDVLVCLNHAAKLSKIKANKLTDQLYKCFEEFGKKKLVEATQSIDNFPRILIASQSPNGIMIKQVEESIRPIIQKGFWKLNPCQKMIYKVCQKQRYRFDIKKFQELITNTFQENVTVYETLQIKKGMTDSMFVTVGPEIKNRPLQMQSIKEPHSQVVEEQLPNFLLDQSSFVENTVNHKNTRNLSIIPQLESVIQNSNYFQGEKQNHTKKEMKKKKEINEGLFKIIKLVITQGQLDKNEHNKNIGVIAPVYSKLRAPSRLNNYYFNRLFDIFVSMANFKGILKLIAETLDFLEQKGFKKLDKLPYWMQKYILFIIEEKGLKFLNDMLEKLNFYDEAVIDAIENAKKWKMKGVTY